MPILRPLLLLAFPALLALGAPGPTPGEVVLTETFATTPAGTLPPGWTVRGGTWKVADGCLVGTSTDYLSRLFLPVGELDNVAIQADVRFLATKNPTRWLSLMVRAETGEPQPFLVFTSRYQRHQGSGLEIGGNLVVDGKREWHIYRHGRQGPALALGDSQQMRLEVRSGQVRAFLDGKLVLACGLAAEIPAQGQVGFVVSDVTASFANVQVERLPPMSEEERLDAVLARCSIPLVLAHRGDSSHFPENTLLAFREAFAQGADGVEMDLRLSRDGQIYLLHDDTLDRTTDGHGRAGEKTLAELQALDAGSWKDARFKGEPIPDLATVAHELRGKGLLVLDLKEDQLGAALAPIVEREGLHDQLLACCWNEAQVANLKQYLPGVRLVKLGEAPSPLPADFASSWRHQGMAGFSLAHTSLTPEVMAQANWAGLAVYTWTINAAPEFREALQLGVDGVLTDAPATARQELRRLQADAWGTPAR